MKLIGRMIPAVSRGLARATLHPLDPLTSRFRVLPHDLDINLHLNNGRYHQLIDVNRLEWLLRTRILQTALRQRWRPLLGGSTIRFRREMRLGACGVLTTRLAGWDDRWFFLEHHVTTARGRHVAFAMAKAAFHGRAGWVPTAAMRDALAAKVSDMPLPPHVEAWRTLEAQIEQRERRPDE